MIDGRLGDNKELFFEIQLVAANDEEFLVEALFDTGFTDGWLAVANCKHPEIKLQTRRF